MILTETETEMKDFWILTSISNVKLSRHNSWYYRLEWYNYARHEIHITDVDVKHRNFKTRQWNQIIERGTVWSVFDQMRLHPTRTTVDRDPLVDADYQPRWLMDLEQDQVETLVAHREAVLEDEARHQYDRLFEAHNEQ